MKTIALFLDHKENRRLLENWLRKWYQIVRCDAADIRDRSFDLGILDGPALDRLWEQVQMRKEAESPVFLPFLMVTARQDVKAVTRHLWRTVDELILTPIEKIELQARVEILLRARQFSVELQRKYFTLAEAAPAGVFIVQDERIVYANLALLEITGRVEKEVIGTRFLDFIYPQDRGEVTRCFQEVSAGDQNSVFETRILTPEGVRWVELSATSDTYSGKPGILGIALDITERKEAEEKIRQSEETYRNLFQNAQVGLFRMRMQDGKVLECNEQLARMFGYDSREELIAESFTLANFVDPGTRERMLEMIRRDGSVENFEARFYRKDRSILWGRFSILIYPERDWIEGVAEDITALKLGEEALRESEAKYRRIAENMTDVVWATDLNFRLTYVSPSIQRLIGVSAEEYLKMGMEERHPPETIQKFKELLTQELEKEKDPAVEKTRTKVVEGQHYKPDGTTIDISMHVAFIRDENGIPIGLQGVTRDITARKRAEAERERLMEAIEQAGEIVIVTDVKGTIQYVNPAFEQLTGYTRAEAIGKNPRILKSGKHDEAFYRNLWETISAGRTWKGRFVNKRKDGTLYTEEATISPVRDASGRIVNFVAVKRDVSEQLRLVGEKVLLQEQLQQAQKLESIGRLAGGVAHDFNNLLSVILGYGQILLQSIHTQDPLRKDVEQMIEAGERAATLVRQLLAFSRKQKLQPEVLDLHSVVQNLEKMLRRLIGEDIQLQLCLSKEIGRVMADPGQIEQVILNLAVNARDAMPEGGRLIIETANVTLDEDYTRNHLGVEPGRYVMLAVTDTGCGMDKETLTKIFEPFFTTKEKGKGTGLGLSTVYGIVKQSGGHIWVYSEPGEGTTIKIYLPQTEGEPETKPLGAKEETARGRGEHILVVEDEESLRKLLAMILARLGYQVTLAADGGEALALAEEKGLKPDLVITDVVMPNMSGKELVRRLQRNQPDLKVLFMSGYTDNAIVRHGVLEPGTAFIQKPFTIDAIAQKVQAVLRGENK